MTTHTTPTVNGFTEAEKQELRAFKATMKQRDRAAEPQRDADVVLAELQTSLGIFARTRESAYTTRNDVRARIKRNGTSFDARQWLAIAEADVRTAEAQIRTARAAIAEWSKIAARQRKAREERQERERKLDAAERKLKGLGLD
jgi:hypothetical protein